MSLAMNGIVNDEHTQDQLLLLVLESETDIIQVEPAKHYLSNDSWTTYQQPTYTGDSYISWQV